MTRLTSIMAILGLAAAAGPFAHAQTSSPKTPVSPAAIARAQRAVDKAAADRKIEMSDSAKRELAVEVARQEAAAPTAAEAPTAPAGPAPEAKVDQMFRQIDFAKPGVGADAALVKEAVAADKASQVRRTIGDNVAAQAAAASITLPDEVRTLLVQDLEKQTDGLAASGLPVDVIRSKNDIFLKAVTTKLQSVPLTPAGYAQVQQQIFQQFVNLRIESVPTGAHVKMNDVELGVTDIASQPLEPGKMYQFEFALAGYQPAKRPYYVAAAEGTALLSEPLELINPASGSADDGPRAPSDDGATFPFLYVTLGVIVLAGLLLFARRR